MPEIAYIETVFVKKILPNSLTASDVNNLFCELKGYYSERIPVWINNPEDPFILVSVEGISGVKMNCICKSMDYTTSINKKFKKPPQTPEQKAREETIKAMLSGMASEGITNRDEFFKRVAAEHKKQGS